MDILGEHGLPDSHQARWGHCTEVVQNISIWTEFSPYLVPVSPVSTTGAVSSDQVKHPGQCPDEAIVRSALPGDAAASNAEYSPCFRYIVLVFFFISLRFSGFLVELKKNRCRTVTEQPS